MNSNGEISKRDEKSKTSNPIRVAHGTRLSEERANLTLTQKKLADLCQVTQRSIAAYESGQRSPDGEFLDHLANAGADVHYIITGKRQPKTHPAAGIPESILNLKIDVARLQSFQTISVRELIMIAEYSASQEAD